MHELSNEFSIVADIINNARDSAYPSVTPVLFQEAKNVVAALEA